MKYFELTVMTTSEAQELVADCFFQLNLEGVSIIDKLDLINLNPKCHKWDYIDDGIMASYGEETLVKGFCTVEEYSEVSKQLLEDFENLKRNSQGYINVGSLEMTKREIEGDDWLNTWKEHFKPIPIRDVVICPRWIDYAKKPNEKIVNINIGMAFGTGEHETTSMCVELLQDFDLNGLTIYDIGCGSGILGITAIKLGAKEAIMSDIDEIAVKASYENALLNNVAESCDISQKDLLNGATKPCDLVVSNITAEVLVLMADDMAKLLPEGKPLILSGILADRVDKIMTAYGDYFTKTKQIQHGEWCGITFVRK